MKRNRVMDKTVRRPTPWTSLALDAHPIVPKYEPLQQMRIHFIEEAFFSTLARQ